MVLCVMADITAYLSEHECKRTKAAALWEGLGLERILWANSWVLILNIKLWVRSSSDRIF